MKRKILVRACVYSIFLIAITACATEGEKVYARLSTVEELAGDGKCSKALKGYDELKAGYQRYQDIRNNLAMLVAGSVSVGSEDRSFTRCLIEAGRYQEVVDQFDSTCFGRGASRVTAQYQSFVCTKSNLRAADRAFKLAGRQNPLDENSGAVDSINRNSQRMNEVDTAISKIYVRRVTAKTGTSAETLQYYGQMKDATSEVIRYLDGEVIQCEQKSDALCSKAIGEKRAEKRRDLADYNREIAELNEDHQAAQRIANAAPAILGAVGSLGSVIAGGSGSVDVPAASGGANEGRAANASPAEQRASPSSSSSSWVFDDFNHQSCVSVEAVDSNTTSGLAYGHYFLKNRCAHPLMILACITTDRADGSPSPAFDQHLRGAQCPGAGWGGTTLGPSETKDERTWFTYNRIASDFITCKEGWSPTAMDGSPLPTNPPIGGRYRCRK